MQEGIHDQREEAQSREGQRNNQIPLSSPTSYCLLNDKASRKPDREHRLQEQSREGHGVDGWV